MTLADETAALKKKVLLSLPPDAEDVLRDFQAQLLATFAGSDAPLVDDQVPDFSLPDTEGENVRLSKLLEDGPVVVSFYRGGWCDFCELELRALQRALQEFEKVGVRLVAVSPQTVQSSKETKEDLDLHFPVLSDEGNRVAKEWKLDIALDDLMQEMYKKMGIDLPAANGDDSWELPLPATFLIGEGQKVLARWVDPDHTKRVGPVEILAAVAERVERKKEE